jgi:hypothetical protein
MEAGQLGYSEAKKRQMVEAAMNQARAQGLGGQQLAQVGAQAMQAANTDSEQQALLRRAEVLRRMKEQAARNAVNWRQSAAAFNQTMQSAAGAVGGGSSIGGMASSLGGVLGK